MDTPTIYNKNAISHYDVLGLSSTATQSQIVRAYHAAVRRYHPDRSHSHQTIQQFQRVQEAYECLRCTKQRRLYDWQKHSTRMEFNDNNRCCFAIPIDATKCIWKRVHGEILNSNNNDDMEEEELIYQCHCGHSLLIAHAHPDNNLLDCLGCSLIYDTTPVWEQQQEQDDE